jgi:hypothetical protein
MLGNVGYRNFPTAFSPAALFAASEPGVWYDPSDVANTNWLYNLLLWTEQFDNAYWANFNATLSANNSIAPDGTSTADLTIPNATNSNSHGVYPPNITLANSTAYTMTVYAKAAGYDFLNLYFGGVTASNSAVFNLSTGQVGSKGASVSTSTITSVGNGWFRCSVTVTTTKTANEVRIYSGNADAGDGRVPSFSGNGTSGILIWGAQIELGSTATTYQPITTVAAETIARFPQATLYQDSAGTTPVTAPAQPVGLMLDKKLGLVLGQNIATATSITGVAIGGPSFTNYQIVPAMTVGQAYEISFTVTGYSGSNTVGVAGDVAKFSPAITGGSSISGNGTIRLIGIASTTGTLELFTRSTNTCVFTNISVRELPGNHATQSTSASRPTYGIVPATGRRNLLTYSEQFDNAVYSKLASGTGVAPVVTANFGTAPDGTITADRVVLNRGAGTGANDLSRIYQEVADPTTGLGTASVYLKSTDGVSIYSVRLLNGSAEKTVTVTGDWQRFDIQSTSTSSNFQFGLQGSTNQQNADILAWGGQFEYGSTATAYQKVVTAFEVTEANVASLSYISFDGVDDFMVTPTITPGTDKVQVFAGLRKLSDAAVGMVSEFSADVNTNNGSWYLLAPVSNGTASSGWLSKGTLSSGNSSTGFTAPASAVLTGLGDISGDLSIQRRNGSQVSQSTADQGTGNFLAYPLYLGRRGGTSLPFNGQMYGLITRFGSNLTTTAISRTESWMNSKTGAY